MIHETAIVEDAVIGEGTNIWHFVHVRDKAVIGKNCNIGKGVYVDTEVVIGDNCKVQNFVSIYKGVTIGNDVFVGPHVCFTNDVNPRSAIWDENRLVSTKICDGASLGANSTILAGITIGRYAMVGAGAVVTKDVPDFGLVYGNPAVLCGFVCECGKKVQKESIRDDVVILKCNSCGKTIEINESVFRMVKL